MHATVIYYSHFGYFPFANHKHHLVIFTFFYFSLVLIKNSETAAFRFVFDEKQPCLFTVQYSQQPPCHQGSVLTNITIKCSSLSE